MYRIAVPPKAGIPIGPEYLRIEPALLPEPVRDEVLIRVQAAGVNRPDVAQRRGLYPPPPDASPVLGLEVAGEVVGLGPKATGFAVGDKVCALTNGGGYAEYAVAPAPQCLPWPYGYDALRAAALPENYFTVWANLFMLGRLAEGERVLVHGGTSGIGITATKLGRAFGAYMYVTAGSAEKLAACERFGAERAINYRTQDFGVEIPRLSGGFLMDVVLDIVGAPYFARNLACLTLDGRLVQIAVQEGAKVDSLDLAKIMTRRLTITGSTMRPRTTAQKGAIAAELRAKVWRFLDADLCGPEIYATFPLAEAAKAHALMESGEHIGKIMLRVAD
jgi:NADPH2:quinone reductase